MTTIRTKLAAATITSSLLFGGGVVLTQSADAQQDHGADHDHGGSYQERMAQREARLEQRVAAGKISAARADEIRSRMEARAADRQERRSARAERLEALAGTIGTTAQELKDDLRAGNSLADIATEAGVDPNAIIDQIVAQRTSHINDAVATGLISQAKADQLLEGLVDRVTARVNR